MSEKKNRLWAAATNAKALEAVENAAHGYACSDHCLVIAPDAPEGFTEVTEELGNLLTIDDWRWILAESDALRREQEEAYHRRQLDEQERFLTRFLEALKEEQGEAKRHEQKKENEADANGG